MNGLKVVKTVGTVCQILGAVGGITMAGFEICEGVNKLKEFKNDQSDYIDSVATDVEVVEA